MDQFIMVLMDEFFFLICIDESMKII